MPRDSTPQGRGGKPQKPNKPYAAFPLFAHANGQWAKKIRGKIHFFGVWRDHQGALNKYLEQKDELHAGRTPRTPGSAGGLTVENLGDLFLNHKRHLHDTREISERTWNEYLSTCRRLADQFGKKRLVVDLTAHDFGELRASIAGVWGAVRLGNEIQRVRSVFKYAYDAGLIDKPVRFGPAFKRPTRKVLRKARADKGERMFSPAEIHLLLVSASVQIRAMILLGINCGFGNEDCATLPISAVDLDGGWVTFPRPKTGVPRRCKLWPETVAAMREVLPERKPPKDAADAGLVFITKYGMPWARPGYGTAITHEIDKLLVEHGIKRPGLGFYALRHTFRTIADGSRDQPVIDFIMGHARDEDMASHYRERIDDARIVAVVEHVHAWLFKDQPQG